MPHASRTHWGRRRGQRSTWDPRHIGGQGDVLDAEQELQAKAPRATLQEREKQKLRRAR